MPTVQSPVSRLAARSRVARSGSAAPGRATVSAADSAATFEHLAQYVGTDIAHLVPTVPAEQRNVPEPVDQTGHERVTGTPISPT
jgi:hypothetical protein